MYLFLIIIVERKEILHSHREMVHFDVKKYTCEICGEKVIINPNRAYNNKMILNLNSQLCTFNFTNKMDKS